MSSKLKDFKIKIDANFANVNRSVAAAGGSFTVICTSLELLLKSAAAAHILSARHVRELAWREEQLTRCMVLGASAADLELHEDIVTALVGMTAESNREFWIVGWTLAYYRLSYGYSVIPDESEIRAWASYMWQHGSRWTDDYIGGEMAAGQFHRYARQLWMEQLSMNT